MSTGITLPETLGEALIARRSSTRAIHYMEGEGKTATVPMQDMYSRALGLLRHLQACGAAPGSELILLVEDNRQFVDVFWACMLGRILVVPLAPGNADEHRWKFFRVLEKLQHPHLCTDAKTLARLTAFAEANGLAPALGALRKATLLIDRVDDISQPGKPHAAQPDDIAFVQYSSGSTSHPKGVALTHGNLLANIAAIAHGISLEPSDVGLSWMPLTHDMGLIGFHLTPFVMDVEHYLMPTALFVRRPQLWLAQAHAVGASILCSPNFGYKHFLKSADPEKIAALDLSRVRVLFNGAEPVSVELCEEFLAFMASAKLNPAAMFPVYGLAEASLAVTFPDVNLRYHAVIVDRKTLNIGEKVVKSVNVNNLMSDASDTGNIALVCAGRPVQGCEVRIAGRDGAALPGDTIGHILIRGANVTQGYYRDPQATRAAITVDGWLDTGDLGFFSDGDGCGLVITGRYKDIIFVAGQNYYPQDIEAVLAQHAGIELGRAAAYGARAADKTSETDDVLAFVLHRGSLEDFLPIAAAAARAAGEHVGVALTHVIPINKMPKTTSGKIQRYLLGEQYARGDYAAVLAQLAALAPVAAPGAQDAGGGEGDVARALQEICDSFIAGKAVGLNDNIFELGMSSLALAQIHQRVEALYPGKLEVTDFFDYPTIAELATYLHSRLKAA